MQIYVLFAFLVCLSLLVYEFTQKKYFLAMPYFLAILLSAFRSNVGVDYHSYTNHFYKIVNGYYSEFEIGNQIVIRLIDACGGGSQVYFIFASVVINVLIYRFINRHCNSLAMSSVLYFFISIFYLASFNAIKQYIAISIFLFSIRYIISRDLFKYLILLFFASIFHLSAVLLLPLYFIVNRKFSVKQLMLGGLISFFVIVNSIEFLASNIFSGSYINLPNNSSSKPMIIAFILVNLYLILSIRNRTLEINIFRNLIFISMLLLIMSLFIPEYSMALIRFNSYFIFAFIPMLSFVYDFHFMKIPRTLISLIIVSMSLFLFFYTLLIKGGDYFLVPYNFTLEVSRAA
jgi:transmembrane protein EpsG